MMSSVNPLAQVAPNRADELVAAAVAEIRRASGQEGYWPFDPWVGAMAIGIRPRICRLPKGIDGRLLLEASRVGIDLSKAAAPQRRRFTLCHELAHLCFIERGVWTGPWIHRELEARMAVHREERVCDRVAANLLMPEAFFRGAAQHYFGEMNGSPTPYDVLRLAVLFDVSARAAHRRIRELRLWKGTRPTWEEVHHLASGKSLRFTPFHVNRNLLYTLNIDSCETALLS